MIKTVAPAAALEGSLHLPADKSISHRAALFAALGEGQSTISNFSNAADPKTTLKCLQQLGVKIRRRESEVVIEGAGRKGLKTPSSALDCENSGTTMRLLSGIVGGAGIKSTLTGDASLLNRTMKRIIEPLVEMGIQIEARDDDFAPLYIQRNGPLKPITFQLPIASAQLKSSVLLAGLFGGQTTRVVETAVSRDHTERLLQLPVDHQGNKKIISSDKSCKIQTQNYQVPGDFSASAYWLVAALLHLKASMQLKGVGVNPTRTGALDILQKMDANISIENERKEAFEPVADILVQSSAFKPVDIGADIIPNCIDELPILMIAMLFANGRSTITGAGELRHKETDRLAAMAEILEIAGASFEEKEDGIIIDGDPGFTPKVGTFDSCGDHRIAMSAAILSLMADEPSRIVGAECTAVSYPDFWTDLQLLSH